MKPTQQITASISPAILPSVNSIVLGLVKRQILDLLIILSAFKYLTRSSVKVGWWVKNTRRRVNIPLWSQTESFVYQALYHGVEEEVCQGGRYGFYCVLQIVEASNDGQVAWLAVYEPRDLGIGWPG